MVLLTEKIIILCKAHQIVEQCLCLLFVRFPLFVDLADRVESYLDPLKGKPHDGHGALGVRRLLQRSAQLSTEVRPLEVAEVHLIARQVVKVVPVHREQALGCSVLRYEVAAKIRLISSISARDLLLLQYQIEESRRTCHEQLDSAYLRLQFKQREVVVMIG